MDIRVKKFKEDWKNNQKSNSMIIAISQIGESKN